MNRFVVLTGLDGSGKDFVAEHLQAADPGSALMQTPTGPFVQVRREVDRLALEMPAAHYYFYLASVIHASQEVLRRLRFQNVYCARYLLDTVVYHRAMGLPVKLLYETPIYRIIEPNLTVFLVVDEHTRQERLGARGKYTVGDRIVDDSELRNAILREYEEFSECFVTVDNSGRPIRDVVDEIRSHIRGSA